MPWKKLLHIAYENRFMIVGWPSEVDLPGPNFDLRKISLPQVIRLLGHHLELVLGEANVGASDKGKGKVARESDDEDDGYQPLLSHLLEFRPLPEGTTSFIGAPQILMTYKRRLQINRRRSSCGIRCALDP